MKASAIAPLAAAVLLSLGFEYLWLFRDQDFSFILLDMPIAPALLLPLLPVLPFLLRRRRALFLRSLLTAGAFRFWLAATILPLASAGTVYLFAASTTADFDATERYNALLIGSALDLPLLFFRCLILLAAQEIAWRLPIRKEEGASGMPAASIAALVWLAAQGMFLLHVFRQYGAAVGIAFTLFLFTLGLFLFLLHDRGSAWSAMWALFLTVLSIILLFENRIPLMDRVLFGENNPMVEGLLSINEVPYAVPLLILAALFLLFALLLRAIPPSRRSPILSPSSGSSPSPDPSSHPPLHPSSHPPLQ